MVSHGASWDFCQSMSRGRHLDPVALGPRSFNDFGAPKCAKKGQNFIMDFCCTISADHALFVLFSLLLDLLVFDDDDDNDDDEPHARGKTRFSPFVFAKT